MPGRAPLRFTVAGGTGTVIDGFVIRHFPGDGVAVGGSASGTHITCNAIGTNAPGTAVQGNGGAGISVRGSGTTPSLVDANIIMNNGGAGVVVDTNARLVAIRGNRIFGNGGLGIDLIGGSGGLGGRANAGGNDLQPAPALSSAAGGANDTTVSGSLPVSAAQIAAGQYILEFFDSPSCDTLPAPGGSGEGAMPIGSISFPASTTPGPGTLTFTANGLDSTNVGDVITATATDAAGLGNTSELSTCVPVVQGSSAASADLSVAGSVVPTSPAGGDVLTYTLVVHNAGPDTASDVVLTNVLPAGLNLDSMDPSCIAVTFTVTCNLGSVDPGDAHNVTVTIVATAQDIGGQLPLDDQASVTGSADDPDHSNDAVTISTTLSARHVNMHVTKSGPASVTEGQTFDYAIDAWNTGPNAAHAVVVTDSLPAGVTFVSAAPSQGTCGQAAGVVTCTLGNIASGPHATIDVQVKASPLAGNGPLTVVNTASVSSDRTDDDPSNDTSAPVSTAIQPNQGADLTVSSVTNAPNPVTGGYDLGYTATVTNLGPGGATKVTLTDALAAGESFVGPGSDPRCTATATLVTCSLGALASGANAALLIVTKTPTVTAETTIHDGFLVSAPEDSKHGNDARDVTTTVRPRRTDWAAGYVPASSQTTWITDATQWSHGDPVATIADPTVAFVGIPGGGPGGPVTITEGPCAAPFSCLTRQSANGTMFPVYKGVFGRLVTITVPGGYDASNPIAAAFLDNWSVIPYGWDGFKVMYRSGSTGTTVGQLPACGGSSRVGPPCVAEQHRIFSWWNAYANADLLSVVRFTGDATFGRAR